MLPPGRIGENYLAEGGDELRNVVLQVVLPQVALSRHIVEGDADARLLEPYRLHDVVEEVEDVHPIEAVATCQPAVHQGREVGPGKQVDRVRQTFRCIARASFHLLGLGPNLEGGLLEIGVGYVALSILSHG